MPHEPPTTASPDANVQPERVAFLLPLSYEDGGRSERIAVLDATYTRLYDWAERLKQAEADGRLTYGEEVYLEGYPLLMAWRERFVGKAEIRRLAERANLERRIIPVRASDLPCLERTPRGLVDSALTSGGLEFHIRGNPRPTKSSRMDRYTLLAGFALMAPDALLKERFHEIAEDFPYLGLSILEGVQSREAQVKRHRPPGFVPSDLLPLLGSTEPAIRERALMSLGQLTPGAHEARRAR